jgi:spermidine/putrescine transport system permease protein
VERESVRKKLLFVYTLLVLLFIYAPMAVLIIYSFNSSKRFSLVWNGLTLDWYGAIFRDQVLVDSTLNSFYVGIIATILAVVLGVAASFVFVRRNFRGKTGFSLMMVAPYLIPGTLFGLALLMFFSQANIPRSLFTVTVAHTTLITPLVFLVVSAGLAGFDRNLEEAAQDLGANGAQVLRHVTFPILMPSIVIGALFAFTISIDEFIVAFFAIGTQNTLPLAIWSALRFGGTPKLNALATLIFVFSFATAIAAELIFASNARRKRFVEEQA